MLDMTPPVGTTPIGHSRARPGTSLKAQPRQCRQEDTPGHEFLLPACLILKVKIVYGKES